MIMGGGLYMKLLVCMSNNCVISRTISGGPHIVLGHPQPLMQWGWGWQNILPLQPHYTGYRRYIWFLRGTYLPEISKLYLDLADFCGIFASPKWGHLQALAEMNTGRGTGCETHEAAAARLAALAAEAHLHRLDRLQLVEAGERR
jgi:hypothetical protein